MPAALGRAAAWATRRIYGIAARVGFALVEGFVFALSPRSIATVLAAELAAFGIIAGPRAPVRVAAGTLFALGTVQTWRWLILSFRHTHKLEEGLQSIWDWEPPGSESSGAWHILRQLAVTMNKMSEENPAVAALLDTPELTGNELAMRLFWYYKTVDEPLLTGPQLAALAAAEAAGSGGDQADAQQAKQAKQEEQEDQQKELPPQDRVAPVPAELKEQLAHYRWAACLCYDYNTDKTLSEQLEGRGYVLLTACHESDLTSGCPAYYLAINEELREVLLCCRGTFSPEDAFVDLLATGTDFDDGSDACANEECRDADTEAPANGTQPRLTGYCHSGMGRAALFMGRKFGRLLRELCVGAGWHVTTAGHSLGAGVASLLAVYLRNRGLPSERLQCWAYETPACMDLGLARGCTDIVTSLVNGDDVVPRACMRSLAGFLEDLASFDWRAAAEAAAQGNGDSNSVDVAQHLSRLVLWAVGSKEDGKKGGRSGGSAAAADGSAEAADEEAEGLLHAAAHEMEAAVEREDGAQAPCMLERLGSGGFQKLYNAHVPGRVVLIYPLPVQKNGNSKDGSQPEKDGSSQPEKDGSSQPEKDGSQPGKSSSQPDENGPAGDVQQLCGLALVDCTSRAVTRLRVSACMLTDHFVDRAPVVQALGG